MTRVLNQIRFAEIKITSDIKENNYDVPNILRY